MTEEEKLNLYIQKLERIAKENLTLKDTNALKALREALNFIESEMTGY